jgi:hypothetical protein
MAPGFVARPSSRPQPTLGCESLASATRLTSVFHLGEGGAGEWL